MLKNPYAALLALGLTVPAGAALAHHGWAWTTGGNVELTGLIEQVRLGNPHGLLDVGVDGETWTTEVGQPWPFTGGTASCWRPPAGPASPPTPSCRCCAGRQPSSAAG